MATGKNNYYTNGKNIGLMFIEPKFPATKPIRDELTARTENCTRFLSSMVLALRAFIHVFAVSILTMLLMDILQSISPPKLLTLCLCIMWNATAKKSLKMR